jgi:hypothetical protein
LRLYQKKKYHKKRVGGLAQGAGPEFERQYHKSKKKKKKKSQVICSIVEHVIQGNLTPSFQAIITHI